MSAVAQALQDLEAEFSPERAARPAAATAAEPRQFVIFHIQGERFAVSLAEVQEIIRVPEVVKVPLSPLSLDGIANLRGQVLPIVSLREAFGFPSALHDDSTRVVVLDHGRPIGLVVDRMANVVTVEPDRIEPAETIRSTVEADFLTGMIRDTDGRSIIMILDPRRVIEREFKDVLGRADTSAAKAGVDAGPARDTPAAEAATAEDQLVSFEVARQEYAFPIERVQEIVQLPEQINEVPNMPAHVLGVITLRNRLLPLMSLRTLFGLPAMAASEANKVVVVTLGEGRAESVGVVMDSVKEVLRVSRTEVEPVPPLLAQGRAKADITAICRLQDGQRLVSVLSADNMFDAADLQNFSREGQGDMAGQRKDDIRTAADLADDEQFVLFRLMGEEYGVPIEVVQEIVRVPSELTKIPNTPSFIEGFINLRGVVLPVVDQRRRFGLEGVERNDRQRIMVFAVRGVRTGFIVDFVSEVRRIPKAAIGAAPSLSDEQQRIIRRVANLDEEKRLILLLDVMQLLNIAETDEVAAVAA
jgi:purine-binding chemotaxis protein CheW